MEHGEQLALFSREHDERDNEDDYLKHKGIQMDDQGHDKEDDYLEDWREALRGVNGNSRFPSFPGIPGAVSHWRTEDLV